MRSISAVEMAEAPKMDWMRARAEMKFLQVKFDFSNQTEEPITLQAIDFSLRDTGGTEEPVELRALAEHALALRHFALGRLRATFTVDGSALVIATVRRDVLQILLNLVVNSEAALRGVPNPALRIVVASSDGGATIAVEDNGKGVSPDQRESLFDRREAAGDGVMSPLGIGLAVASANIVTTALIAIYLATTITAAVRTEEASLRRQFGDAYGRYKSGSAAAPPRRFSLERAIANREHRTVAGIAAVVLLLVLKATYNGLFWRVTGR